ncbi:MAG TPA: phage holin family protein [Kofleriaceae bacterium]|nr:phage holin family protein [Kofleriaceae bacterium]
MTAILIKLAIRLAVFGVVFWLSARSNDKVELPSKWATPLVALVFAALNTALYYLLVPVLAVATLGAIGFALPLVVNVVLLAVTARIFQSRGWFKLGGLFATLWMATFLTIAHGLLWLALDYIPAHV